jgi:hypothetical protein
VVEWEISEQESCSDHSIIRYAIGQGKGHRLEFGFQDVRFIVKKDNKEIFQRNLLRLAEKTLCKINKEGETENLEKHYVHECLTKLTLKRKLKNSTKS